MTVEWPLQEPHTGEVIETIIRRLIAALNDLNDRLAQLELASDR
jgi:hypothetical protein